MTITKEQAEREIDRIRKMPWSAHFHRTFTNKEGNEVDMYLLIDDDTGEGIVSVGVPRGRGWIAEYIAKACADPFFVRQRNAGDTGIMAQAPQADLLHRGHIPCVGRHPV